MPSNVSPTVHTNELKQIKHNSSLVLSFHITENPGFCLTLAMYHQTKDKSGRRNWQRVYI